MTTYMARSAWTDEPRGGAQLTGTQLVGIAGHWPGTTTNAYGVESASTVAARLRGWWNYHVNVRGWSDIGYNMAADQAGRVWDLRGLSRVGAHAASASNPDANHEWLGVLFILGDQEQPTPAMVRAFQDFRHDVFLPRWPARYELRGHGQVPGASTSCPGPYVRALIADGTLTENPEDDDMPTVQEIINGLASSEEFLNQVRRWVWERPQGGTEGNPSYISLVNEIAADAEGARVGATQSRGKLERIEAETLPDIPRAVQAYKNAAFVALGDAYKIARDALMHAELARRLTEEASVGPITAERRDQIVAEVEVKYQPVT